MLKYTERVKYLENQDVRDHLCQETEGEHNILIRSN